MSEPIEKPEPIDRHVLAAHLGQIHRLMVAETEHMVALIENRVALTEAVGELQRCLAGEGTKPAEPDLEPGGESELQRLWRTHAAGRPELAGVEVDQEQLRQLLDCLTYRLDAAARHSLLMDAEACETGISGQPPRGDDGVEDALVDIDAGQADAVRTILYLAQHDTGLGRIDLRTGAQGTWLASFAPQDDYPDYRRDMLKAVHNLREAPNPDKRQDAVVWLDHVLRQLVPVEHRPDGLRIVPPAPDSTWAQALERSFDAVELTGKKASPPLVAGIPPVGITISEAERKHHTVRAESRSQDVDQEHDGEVLWQLGAWTGRETGNRTPNLQNKAKVVYGKAQRSYPYRPPGE